MRIVVVDDNQDAADMLALLLETTGAEVAVAYDGHSALELVRNERPSVVLLDIGLPDIDGYDVARAIRAQPEGAPVFLIALTGYSREEDIQRARDAGFDRHLVKPVDLSALTAAIAAVAAPTQ